MKDIGQHFPVKRYPFKFSALMLALGILGIAVSAAGIGLTTWQFTDFLKGPLDSPYEWMKFILLYLASILLFVLLLAMFIRSQYIVTDKEIVMQFGLIRSKYAIKDICSVHLFHGAKKLAVYFDDFKTKYVVIVVKEAWYDDFMRAIVERNERVAVSFSTEEEEEAFKKGKK